MTTPQLHLDAQHTHVTLVVDKTSHDGSVSWIIYHGEDTDDAILTDVPITEGDADSVDDVTRALTADGWRSTEAGAHGPAWNDPDVDYTLDRPSIWMTLRRPTPTPTHCDCEADVTWNEGIPSWQPIPCEQHEETPDA